jgi:hypothetical protein
VREQEQGWQAREFGAAHEGRVGVVLADGTTPRPVVFVSLFLNVELDHRRPVGSSIG